MPDYKPNDIFPLPDVISHHELNGKHLFIAPYLPSWIVINHLQGLIFAAIKNMTLAESVIYVTGLTGHDIDYIHEELEKLLGLCVDRGFIKDCSEVVEYNSITLHLYITNICNYSCKYCYMDSGILKEKKNQQAFGNMLLMST